LPERDVPGAPSPAGALPPATVVVCSRNRPQLLLDTVESVLAGDELPAELVVIDQSDAPHEALAARASDAASRVRYLWTRETGVSRGRNAGLAAARHDIVAFTDDDVFVDRNWLAALVRALAAAGPRAVVTGRVLSTPAEAPGGFAPALVASEVPAVYEGRPGRDVLEAGNMAAYRAALQAVGGFDESLGPGTRFPAGEDNDFGYRLLAAGLRILYVPGATLYHRAWREGGEYLPLRWRYGIGQGAYYAKHLSLADRYMLRRMGKLVVRHATLAARRAPREPRPALGHLVYIAGLLVGATRWRLARGGR
jgi:GT2 family glycosyltransferase